MSTLDAEVEAIKAKVDIDLNHPSSRISDVFLSHVQTVCQTLGSCSSFVVPLEELRLLPAGDFKVKKYIFQILVLFCDLAQKDCDDPVPEEQFATLLQLLREAAPVSVSIHAGAIVDFLQQIDSVYGEIFPVTLENLKVSIGFVLTEPVITDIETIPKRVHYDDGTPAEETATKNRVIYKQSVAGRTVHLKVKKSRDVSGKARGHFAGYEQKYF